MKKTLKIIAWTLFGIYCLLLFYVLVIKRLNPYRGYYAGLRDFLSRVNLIPFRTLYDYVVRLLGDHINLKTVVANLAGNLVLMLPMGVFLPCLFPKTDGWKRMLRTMLVMILSVEFLQLLTALGSFDVDDLILNLGGAMIGYALIRIPVIKARRDNFFSEEARK